MTRTLGGVLENRADDVPDEVFLRFGESDLTFSMVDEACNRVARGLSRVGVRAGEPAAIMLPNCREYVISWLALAKLGAPVAGLNNTARGQALADIINLTGSRVLIVDAPFLDAVDEVADLLTTLSTVVVR
ncbi:MAG: AMP-binding protein, partial [Actinobacteria bacterium]|nr:AMP-binding protein [Actinomycetota bacterium]